ncbi:hypothetical protein [Sinomonas sp. B1-1]|uniref:hypothetical protein n=1 Tax=Sinomonas sp. B1-1 TaxID=3141454 RepID=UPI003D2BE182
MDLDLLTVLIAVGGMATGVGAIWAAWVARRQLRAHAEFVEEQNVLMRRQTELTAESVAAQLKSLQLRDERERIRLEVSVMSQLWEEWTGPIFQRYRRASFQYFLDHYLVDGQLREPQYIDGGTRALFNFYTELGYLTRTGVLRAERVLDLHGNSIRHGWALWRSAAMREREMWSDPARYADFEYLYGLAVKYRDRGEPSQEELLLFLRKQGRTEEEMLAAAESPLPARERTASTDS